MHPDSDFGRNNHQVDEWVGERPNDAVRREPCEVPPNLSTIISPLTAALAVWVAGLILLLVIGKLFSNLTRQFISRSDQHIPASRGELALRKMYGGIISIAGVYFYISLPFFLLLCSIIPVSVAYGLAVIAFGGVTWAGAIFILAIAFIPAALMIKPLFVRTRRKKMVRMLQVEEAPALWELSREVAEILRTRPFDEIQITPDVGCAVTESGSWRERHRDRAKRIFILGAGLIDDFPVDSFCAILAHEYGHLLHRDTLGGHIAVRVEAHLRALAYVMATYSITPRWNPGYRFLCFYEFIFRRIRHGAIRQQEVLADRIAAIHYGHQAFEDGLRHLVHRDTLFSFTLDQETARAMRSGRPMVNPFLLKTLKSDATAEGMEKTMTPPTSEDDTHPSPADRFRFIQGNHADPVPSSSRKVWDLFVDPKGITEEMTALLQKSLY